MFLTEGETYINVRSPEGAAGRGKEPGMERTRFEMMLVK